MVDSPTDTPSHLDPAATPAHADRRLVVVDASVAAARTAHSLECLAFFVQRPGAPVRDLVDDHCGYYTVDFAEDADPQPFTDFVTHVLGPLAPTAVVALSPVGLRHAAAANSLLGTAGPTTEDLKRLTAATAARGTGAPGTPATGPDGPGVPATAPRTPGTSADGGRELTAYTVTSAGEHRWVAVLDPQSPPTAPADVVPEQALPAAEHAAVRAALTGLLDAAGVRTGPVRSVLRTGPGGAVRITAAEPVVDDTEAALVRRHTGVDLTRLALTCHLGPLGPEGGAR